MTQIGRLLGKQGLAKGLELFRAGQLPEAMLWLDKLADKAALLVSDRETIARAFYEYAKRLLKKREYSQSLSYLRKSLDFDRGNRLVQERVSLLSKLIDRNSSVTNQLFLSEFATRLEIGGTQLRHFAEGQFLEYATLMSLIAPKSEHMQQAGCPCVVYFMGKYHPYQPGHTWTRAIRHLKNHSVPGIETALAALVADFLYMKTDILHSVDYIVPVPPDPKKFVQRGLFAPNDILASQLSVLLALPLRTVITRKAEETSTREATFAQKYCMYEIADGDKRLLQDRGILLLEDVATSGGTIVACIKRCVEAQPHSIHAMILGETGGGI